MLDRLGLCGMVDIAVLLLGALPTYAYSYAGDPVSIDILSREAAIIVEGTVQTVESVWNPEGTQIFSTVSLRVDLYHKGGRVVARDLDPRWIRPAIFQFVHLGGTVGDTTLHIIGQPTFTPAEKIVVFMSPEYKRGQFPILRGEQGKFTKQLDRKTLTHHFTSTKKHLSQAQLRDQITKATKRRPVKPDVTQAISTKSTEEQAIPTADPLRDDRSPEDLPPTTFRLFAPALAESKEILTAAPPTKAAPFVHWDLREFMDCKIPWTLDLPVEADLDGDGFKNRPADQLYAQDALAKAFGAWEAVEPAIISFSFSGRVDTDPGATHAHGGIALDGHFLMSFAKGLTEWDDQQCPPGPSGRPNFVVAPGLNKFLQSVPVGGTGDDYITSCILTTGKSETPALGDDEQIIPVGQSGEHANCNVAITPGPGVDNELESLPQGDDFIGYCIVDGGDGQADVEPWVRPSFDPNTLAMTGIFFNTQSGAVLESDIVFNSMKDFREYPHNYKMAVDDPHDFTQTAIHEIGHALGIAHPIDQSHDDKNEIAPGYSVAPGQTIVNAGKDGVWQTDPMGGEEYHPDEDGTIIREPLAGSKGNNGVADTYAGNRLWTDAGRPIMNPVQVGFPTRSNHRLHTADKDALNFLYTPDLGDAPSPYPSAVLGTLPSRKLGGVQLYEPASGAVALFGYGGDDPGNAGLEFEWLGDRIDGHADECKPLATDQGDDGLVAPDPLILEKSNRVELTVTHTGRIGRYDHSDPNKVLYVHGYFDFNGDGIWDESTERHIEWAGTPDVAGDPGVSCRTLDSKNLVGLPVCTSSTVELEFDVAVPENSATDFYARIRLDYGEDGGLVQNFNGDLDFAEGVSQFGEIEDYHFSAVRPTGTCCSGSSGDCVDTIEASCVGQGDVFTAGGQCEDVRGCCLEGRCFNTASSCCEAQGGTALAEPCGEVGDCTTTESCVSESSLECCDLIDGDFGLDGCSLEGCDVEEGTGLEELELPEGPSGGQRIAALQEKAQDYDDGLVTGRRGARTGGIDASIVNGVLTVLGTPGDDLLAFEFSPPDSIQLLDLTQGPLGTFVLKDFVELHVDVGDGDDLVAFDDRLGTVSSIVPTDIDLGTGQDVLVGGTGNLSISAALDQMNILLQAQTLFASAQGLIDTAGAKYPLGDGSDDLISEAFGQVEKAYTEVILPATTFINDAHSDLILPASDFIREAHDVIIVEALRLFADAYNDLALEALALRDDAQIELLDVADDYITRARAIEKSANDLVSRAKDDLVGVDASQFMADMNRLTKRITKLVSRCEEADEAPRFDEQPNRCPEVQDLVDCAEERAEEFLRTVERCENEGHALDSAGSDFDGDIQSDLGDQGAIYEARGDALVVLADELIAKADAFELLANDFESRVQTELVDQAEAFQRRGQNDLLFRGLAYASEAQQPMGSLATALEDQATVLTTELADIMAQAGAILGNGSGLGAQQCGSIVADNTVTGGPGANLLLGTVGNDHIRGLGGSDLIIGGAGSDRIFGGSGVDLIFGGSDANELHGGQDTDFLVGGPDADCMFGDDGIDLMVGLGRADEMEGGTSIDVMLGMDGADVMRGDDGIDVLVGLRGADEIRGGGCIDVIFGGPGADKLYGDAGQTVSVGSLSLELGNLIFGGDAADTIHGAEQSNDGVGIDVLFGGGGNDTIGGAHGGLFTLGSFEFRFGNLVFAQDGNDTVDTKDGVDVVFGGAGDDTITAGKGHTLSLNNAQFTLDLGDLVFGTAGNDTIHGDGPELDGGIDVLFGGIGDDTITASNGGDVVIGSFKLKIGNVLFGSQGSDVLHERDGIGLLFGGIGDDTMSGGSGHVLELGGGFKLNLGDLLFGSAGNDTLHGDDATGSQAAVDDGIDLLFAGAGDDKVYSGGGGDLEISGVTIEFGNLLIGSQGDDLLRADYLSPTDENGIDVMLGGAGDDTLEGGDGGDVSIGNPPQFKVLFGNIMFGSADEDTLRGGDGFDLMFAGSGNDSAHGEDGIDLVFGSGGYDHLEGANGGTITIPISGVPTPIPFGNLMFGGDGEDEISSAGRVNEIDILFGNECDDDIRCGDGLLDLTFGNAGDDRIRGQQGIDIIFANQGNDVVDAGGGAVDLVFGNRGDDQLSAGPGAADIVFGNQGIDAINGGAGAVNLLFGNRQPDMIVGAGTINLIFGNDGGDELIGDGSLDLIFGNRGPDWIDGGSGSGFDLLFGNSDDDVINGRDGLDLIFGNDGGDRISGGAGFDLIFGNRQNDIIRGGGSFDLIFGNTGNDIIFGGPGKSLAFGNEGDDTLLGDSSGDLLLGNRGNDRLQGAAATDILFGNRDNDIILGGGARDFVFGNRGDDKLSGGAGKDIMFGNKQDDAMSGGSGKDRILGNRNDDTLVGGNDGTKDWLFGNRNKDILYKCNKDRRFGGFGKDSKPGGCPELNFGNLALASIEGRKWSDLDGDGTGDAGLAGITIYLSGTGRQTVTADDDPDTHEDETGQYRFERLAAGSYTVRETVPDGYTQVGTDPVVSLGPFSAASNVDFVNTDDCRPTVDGTACIPGGCREPSNQCRPSSIEMVGTCDNDASTCSNDDDCCCDGTCVIVQKITECACVPVEMCELAGDEDDFASGDDPQDVIHMRPEFETWLSRVDGNNDHFHDGEPLPFDVVTQARNWEFGYSFVNVPPINSGTLTLHVKAGLSSDTTNDGLSLQYSAGPAFAWGIALGALEGLLGGDGIWQASDELTVTLDLSALPLASGGTLDLTSRISNDGYLDVYLTDDTGIDYIDFCYEPGEPSGCEKKEWILVSESGPSGRHSHAMAYVDSAQHTLLFGGYDGAYKNDTWARNGSSWTQLATTGPSAREFHGMAYDSARDRVVMFGGYQAGVKGDTWEWDGSSWTQVSSVGPVARSGHGMAYDKSNGVIVLFGGSLAADAAYFNDTWSWDGSTWTQAASAGPEPRSRHAMAYDSVRGQVVVYGGQTAGGWASDTWTLELATGTWTLAATTGPSPRTNVAMAFDEERERMILFGGQGGPSGGFLGETWAWDGTAWSQILGPEPGARALHAMAYDAQNRTVLVNGGAAGSGGIQETWAFQCSSTATPIVETTTEQDSAESRRRRVLSARTARAPLVPAAPHDAKKNRYISFVPNNPRRRVAFEILLPPACRRGWVGEPALVDFNGADPAYVAYVVDEPVYRRWNEDVVHVTGCAIAPENQYELRATADGLEYSEALLLHTSDKWGDVVGRLSRRGWTPPNGVVDQDDVNAVLAKIAGHASAPHVTWVDLGPQWVDYNVDRIDSDRVTDARLGGTYPPSALDYQTITECPLTDSRSTAVAITEFMAQPPADEWGWSTQDLLPAWSSQAGTIGRLGASAPCFEP